MKDPKLNTARNTNRKGRVFFQMASSILISSTLIVSLNASAQDGAALYRQNCGVCHTIGKGKLVGPDLSGVTKKRSESWLLSWTKSSQSFIKAGDADAKAIFDEFQQMPMPDQSLSDGEIKAVFTYVESQSGGEVASADTANQIAAPAARSTDSATAEEIALGQNLFEGRTRFMNGGASCISCHNVNYKGVTPGGLLAKDLTTVHSRLGGDPGVMGIMGAPPFPAMTQAYKNRALTEAEIFSITAFLNKVDKDVANQITSPENPLLMYGPIAFIIVLLVIFGMFFSRKKHTVKKEILDRQIKSF